MKSTKPSNMKTVTRVATAANQRGDSDLASDGMKNGSSQPARAQGYAGNQYSGVQNPNKTINMGRGHTVGNDGSCGHSGFADSSCGPITAAVPAVPKQGSVRDSINRGAQVRTPGGTRAMPATGRVSFDYGRGPTKGNQC